jgi:small-conductance mechanosensitive channel
MSDVLSLMFDPATWEGAMVYGLLFALAAWLAGAAITRAVSRSQRFLTDPTAIGFLGALARVTISVFAIILYVHQIPALRHLGAAVLTSVGLISVVLGLAAQTTLNNLIAGLALVLYRPFHLGDEVELASPVQRRGVVTELSLGFTVLQSADHERVIVPNGVMSMAILINRGRPAPPHPDA